MIKMGGVIQGEITRLVLRIRGVINYFKKLETPHFHLVYNIRRCKDLTSRPL